MRTIELIRESNDLADENEGNAVILGFLNQAMAKINTMMNSAFPYLILENDDAPAFSEKWQRTLLIPFAVGRIKQKDSSQFEYSDAYGEFMNNLDEFKTKYNVPIQYRCLEEGQYYVISDDFDGYTETDDTFYSLALRYEVDWRTLVNLNPTLAFVEESFTGDDLPSYDYLRAF